MISQRRRQARCRPHCWLPSARRFRVRSKNILHRNRTRRVPAPLLRETAARRAPLSKATLQRQRQRQRNLCHCPWARCHLFRPHRRRRSSAGVKYCLEEPDGNPSEEQAIGKKHGVEKKMKVNPLRGIPLVKVRLVGGLRVTSMRKADPANFETVPTL